MYGVRHNAVRGNSDPEDGAQLYKHCDEGGNHGGRGSFDLYLQRVRTQLHGDDRKAGTDTCADPGADAGPDSNPGTDVSPDSNPGTDSSAYSKAHGDTGT